MLFPVSRPGNRDSGRLSNFPNFKHKMIELRIESRQSHSKAYSLNLYIVTQVIRASDSTPCHIKPIYFVMFGYAPFKDILCPPY